jgi:hypothetical protein
LLANFQGRGRKGTTMDIIIRIFTHMNGFNDSRSIELDENQMDIMIENYLKESGYLKDREIVTSINYESIKL